MNNYKLRLLIKISSMVVVSLNIRIENYIIKLLKIGFVKVKLHIEIKLHIKSVTISKNPRRKYFISILTEQNIEKLTV